MLLQLPNLSLFLPLLLPQLNIVELLNDVIITPKMSHCILGIMHGHMPLGGDKWDPVPKQHFLSYPGREVDSLHKFLCPTS
jgi:hypothetical protein